MTTLVPWYQQLYWRAAISFIVIFVAIQFPVWWFVQQQEFNPTRATERGLAAATLGALAAVLLHTIATRIYMRRRMHTARDVMLGGSPRSLASAPDEVGNLAVEVRESMDEMRTRLQRLELESGRLRTLLQGMGDAVLMFDDAERVLVANRFAEKLLALPADYAHQRVVDVCSIPKLHALVAEVLWAHEPSTIELTIEYKLELRHLSVTATPILSREGVGGGVLVIHDHTKLRRLERVRRDFVANVSHELRTPIATISSATETLLMADLDIEPQLGEFLRTIERNAARMQTIVEDLLMLSKLEAAGEDLDLGEVVIAEVFAQIIDVCEPMAASKGVNLSFEIGDVPSVYAESGALRQIVQNLIENAIKYTPSGGDISVRVRQKGKRRVYVYVEDNGPGIPHEHIPRIFERFYRVDVGRSREIGGTGLGLSIVKHLSLKIKSRIHVDSDPERGTKFTLSLRTYRPEVS